MPVDRGPIDVELNVRLIAPGAEAWRVSGRLAERTEGSGSLAWLVAGRDEQRRVWRRLLGAGGGVLGPSARTLRQAADAVLASDKELPRPLTGVQRRWLVRRLLEDARRRKRLGRYASAVDLDRLVPLLCREFAALSIAQLSNPDRHRRGQPQGEDAADGELAALHATYREWLQQHRLLDDEGRLAAAAARLESGVAGPFAGVGRLIVTGLRRFNALEMRLVAAIGRHADSVSVEFPWHAAWPAPLVGERGEQEGHVTAGPWAPVRQAVTGLAARFTRTRISVTEAAPAPTDDPEAAATPPRLVRDWLFRDPRAAPACDGGSAGRLRVVAARGRFEELRSVASEVKRLLHAGVAPEAIVLSTRRIGEVAAHAEQAFREAGAPLFVERSTPIRESPLYRAAQRMVRLAAGDWRLEELLAVATAPGLTLFDRATSSDEVEALRAAGFPGPRAAVEVILRELSLPAGRQECLRQLGAIAERAPASPAGDQGEPTESRRRRRRRLASAAAADRLGAIDQSLGAWRAPATPIEWFDRLRGALSAAGYRSGDDPELAALDEAALPAMEAAFASLEQLAGWRAERAPVLALDELAELMSGWATDLAIDAAASDEGRVRLLTAETARLERPDYLFLVGMTEQSFPAPTPSANRTAEEHSSDEMLLFYELTHSSAERVTFSYASVDSAGQPLSPSSYVAEIERLVAPVSLRPESPAADPPTTMAALRCAAVRSLEAGDAGPLGALASADRAAAAPLMAGLRVSLDRSSGDSFGAAEGMLLGAAAQSRLAEAFSPAHLWSPTQLESYAKCPFKFFSEQVLGVEPPPGAGLSIDYRRRGMLLHQAMVELHARLNESGDAVAAIDAMDDDRFADAFHAAVAASAAALASPPQEAPLIEVEAMQARVWGDGYREQWVDYVKDDAGLQGSMRPAYFETRFGPPREGEPLAPPSRPEPFPLEVDGEQVLLTGQVDRIDIGEVAGQTVFNVVDYKTSRSITARLSDLRAGRQLQLYLYTLAVEHHLLADQGARAWRLGYWALRGKGFEPPKESRRPLTPTELHEGRLVTADDWNDYSRAVMQRVGQIVRGVRRGEFPMFNTDENCGRQCDFRTVCRVGQARSLGKQPPGAADGPAGGAPAEGPPP